MTMMNRISSLSVVAAGAVALMTILAVPSSYAEEELPVIASADASNASWEGSTVDVNSLDVSESGGYATLTYTITSANASIRDSEFQNSTYLYTGYGMTGIVLVDTENGYRYNTALDSTGQCMCSVNTASTLEMVRTVEAGRSATFWASYLISEETTSVSVEVPGFEPVTDIAVE
jgi:hypothetical protein